MLYYYILYETTAKWCRANCLRRWITVNKRFVIIFFFAGHDETN